MVLADRSECAASNPSRSSSAVFVISHSSLSSVAALHDRACQRSGCGARGSASRSLARRRIRVAVTHLGRESRGFSASPSRVTCHVSRGGYLSLSATRRSFSSCSCPSRSSSSPIPACKAH
eukprot:3204756-Rhodomonas_salina.1